MRIATNLAVILWAVLLQGRLAAPQQLSAADAANNFCQLDTNGQRLNATGSKELAQDLLLGESTWEQPAEIVVVSGCSVRPLAASPTDSLVLVVDYHILGRMDSSLFLTRLQAPNAGQPNIQSERFSLVLTDTYTEIGSDGKQQQIKGPLRWRIKSYPSEPHVSINAAMAYVRMMGYHAKDMQTKMNAQKTLSELQEMLAPTAAKPESSDPASFLSQFIEMQMGGLGLQSDSAAQMSTFLMHPESQQRSKIAVARAYAVKKTTFAGKNATVAVEFASLGEIDPQLRFTNLGERGTIVQQNYKLLLDNKYSVPASGAHPASEFVGPSRWLIEDAPAEQWISISTAVKYVTQMRDATRDPSIKANADKTLAILKGLR